MKQSGIQKFTLVIILLFFIFNLTLFILTLTIDASDIKQMVNMARYVSYMKYLVVVNMVLFISIIAVYYHQIGKFMQKGKQKEVENTGISSIDKDQKEFNSGRIEL